MGADNICMEEIMNSQYFIEPEETFHPENRQRASYVRKAFRLPRKPVRARIRLTACGIYKAYVNGRELDKQVFLPGFTDYRKRLQYQEYEISGLLTEGENVIAAVIGDGWYRGCLGLSNRRNVYGERLKFFCSLEVCYEDGTTDMIHTGPDWKAYQDGAIGLNDLKLGECCDARREPVGFKKPGFSEQGWHGVKPGNYEGELIPQEGERILEHERFVPKVLVMPNGETVLDFGQNMAGYVEFKVRGQAGDIVSLYHGETLDENGNFTIKNLQPETCSTTPGELGQTVTYILKDGYQTYKPAFFIAGFRYVKLENWPEPVRAENFQAVTVYSDLPFVGEFECSNTMVNQFISNVRWSLKSNFLDIPTDCPTRERAGWTGDISVFCETACYLTDPEEFLKKWMNDFAALQYPDGNLPYVVPDAGLPFEAQGCAGWCDAIEIIPHTLYTFYGHQEILEKYYETIRRWVDFCAERAQRCHPDNQNKAGEHRKYIVDTGLHFGEWLEPGSVMSEDMAKAKKHPDEEVATGYFAFAAASLAKIARILGREADAGKYGELSDRIREAYRKEFLTEGRVVSKRQCRYVRPIMLDLVSEEEKQRIADDLNRLVIQNGYRIGTGFLTTGKILWVLSRYGHADTAYGMLENTEQPGWLYPVTKGATTVWENWMGIDANGVPRDSMNHYAPGGAAAWLFAEAAGIQPLRPGFEKVRIAPVPGGTFTYVQASYRCRYGEIQVHWERKDNGFTLQLAVPVPASVILPDGSEHEVKAGSYSFRCMI